MIKVGNSLGHRFLFLVSLVLLSCTSKKKEVSKQEVFKNKIEHVVFICPMECENGMNYYMEGKCDVCHINLVKQE